MSSATDRIFTAAVHFFAVRGISYPDQEEITKAINLAIKLDEAIEARAEEIEKLFADRADARRAARAAAKKGPEPTIEPAPGRARATE